MPVELYARLVNMNVRLQVVDGQLDIQAPKGALNSELLQEIRTQKSALIDLIASYKQKKRVFTAIPALPAAPAYTVSSSQRRLWILSQFEEANIAYNIPGAYVFEGQLDVERFSAAYAKLIARHESLRTVFFEDAETGEVWQRILTNNFALSYHTASEESVQSLVAADFRRPFDLVNGPLIRATLYQLAPNRWIFTYVMHHIISDGWSMNILVKELLAAYHAPSNQAPPLRIQYKDYAAWQQAQSVETHRQWWLDQFTGPLPVLELNGDHLRPAVKQYRGGSVRTVISPEALLPFKQLLQEEGSTLFMGLLSLVKVLLYRYTGQDDIIIGSPVAGREHADLEDQIGFYVNTLALRTHISGTYTDLLRQVKQTTLGAYEHQQYPFDTLVDELSLPRDLSRHPLFDVMVVLQNTGNGEQHTLSDVTVKPYGSAANVVSKFDLLFNFAEVNDTLELLLEYDSDIYAGARATRIAAHITELLTRIPAQRHLPIAQLDYIPTEETTLVLHTFNDTAVTLPDKTVMSLFADQALLTPDHTALVVGEDRLTYKELFTRSRQLAAHLQNEGVQPGDYVGVLQERSALAVISMLGIMETGAVYVPIDKALPPARVEFIINACAMKVLLKDDLSYDTNTSFKAPVITGDDLSFVIYTSGSTGTPKGVEQTHRTLYNLVIWDKEAAGLLQGKRWLQFSSFSFDSSLHDIYYVLATGGEVHVISETLRQDLWLLRDYVIKEKIATLSMPYAALKAMFSAIPISGFAGHSIEEVISTGEQLYVSGGLKEFLQHYPSILLHNFYGPSETHVITGINYSYSRGDIPEKSTIGRPVYNSRVYILDPLQQLAPIGIEGEVYLAGWHLARGYQGRPDLTAEKFIPDPFYPGELMYRSGDIGRWLETGELEYNGRRDNQLKINGYRVELGEIESLLRSADGIEEAIVIAIGEQDKELAAYIVSQQEQDISQLRAYLSARLPFYMVPLYYQQLPALPLTVNGKVDKRALPHPGVLVKEYIAPRTPTEETLAAIWSDILGREQIGVTDNFFDLGGHSLKATRLVSQVRKRFTIDFSIRQVFTAPTIAAQAVVIDSERTQQDFIEIPVLAPAPAYKVSSSQRRLWILSQFEDANIAYNMPGAYIFEGQLDVARLSDAYAQLIARHESLRTVFHEDAETGEVWQRVLTHCAALAVHTASAADIPAMVEADFQRPFDLINGPLVSATLYQTGDQRWIFVYVMHHIISDGWSMNILVKELLAAYHDPSNQAPPLRIQYKDYAAWQQAQSVETHRQWWLDQFSGPLPVFELNGDHLRPAVKRFRGGSVHTVINADALIPFKQLLQEEGSTLFMGLLSLVNVLLYRYTGQDDIIIGSPVAGREHADLEDQIGFYVNTLALRSRISGTYTDLLQRVKQTTLGAYEHQLYPFDTLVDELSLPRDLSRNPLFDIMVVLQNTGNGEQHQLDNVTVQPYRGSGNVISKFDLLFNFVEVGDTLELHMEYDSDMYTRNRATRIATHLGELLTRLPRQRNTPIDLLDYLPATERNLILHTFNDTAIALPGKTVMTLFAEQASLTPDRIALVVGEDRLTYQELFTRSRELAAYLQQELHIQPGDYVGVLQERSTLAVISMIAIMDAGGIYVPIDNQLPPSRIDYIVKAGALKALLTDVSAPGSNYTFTPPQIHGEDAAFVIYTSGSTGTPKGVEQTHRTLYNLMQWCINRSGVNTGRKYLQFCSFGFDVSLSDIYYALCSGGELHIASEEARKDMWLLKDYLLTTGINTLSMPCAAMKTLFASLSPEEFAGHQLEDIISAGEQLYINGGLQQFLSLHPNVRLHNWYGPSETHVITGRSYSYSEADIPEKAMIGSPVFNSRVYILDSLQQLLPLGVEGEVYLAGAHLARGYKGRPDLTAEKFIPDPFYPGELMYRSGDIGRWLENGELEYQGRRDNQLKINGYRVELGEIESLLRSAEGIEEVVVIAIGQEDKQLAAYIVSQQPQDITQLRAYLSARLPFYMVPLYYEQLPTLPLTANGKVDKRALPQPGIPAHEYIAPRTPTEQTLSEIWHTILGRDQVGVTDNFFEQGGHSLKATRLVSQVRKRFSVDFSIRHVFTAPTIAEQAILIDKERPHHGFIEIPVLPAASAYAVSSSQRRLWILSQFEEANIAYNMPGAHVFEGQLDVARFRAAYAQLIARHESLRTVFYEDPETGEVWQRILTNDIALSSHTASSENAVTAEMQQHMHTNDFSYTASADNADTSGMQQHALTNDFSHTESAENADTTGMQQHALTNDFSHTESSENAVTAEMKQHALTNDFTHTESADNADTSGMKQHALTKDFSHTASAKNAVAAEMQQHALTNEFSHSESADNADTSGMRQHALTNDFALSYHTASEESVKSLVAADFRRPFDLVNGPLIRATLYQVAPNRWIFVYVMHHIISDGWSMNILVKELLAAYHNPSNQAPPLRIQYKDYAAWQQAQSVETHRQWWLDQFTGTLPVLELNGDHLRPAVKQYRGGSVRTVINREALLPFKQLLQEEESTLFMGLLSLVNVLLYRYTGQDDIIIGSPVAGREHADLEDQIGFYVNTLALRTHISGTYTDLLRQVKQTTLGAYEHQQYPFDTLVDELSLPRDLSRHPLFDVMVVLQNTGNGEQHTLSDVTVKPYGSAANVISKFDLLFSFAEVGDTLELYLEYDSDIYAGARATRIASHITELLTRIPAQRHLPIAQLDYLPTEETTLVLHTFNDTAVNLPDKTVMSLFADQALLTPDRTALVVGEDRLTYKELFTRSRQLAAHLQNELGVQPGDYVGVLQERSALAVISMLGIMETGAVYVPIDKALPPARVEFIINACAMKVLLKDDLSYDTNTSFKAPVITGDDLSFVIYTSGSTGTPKGVEQTHRTLYNLVIWDKEATGLLQGKRWLQFSSFSFDSSLHDIYYILATGGEVHVISETLRQDLWLLRDYVIKEKIATLSMPYAALKAMFSAIPVSGFAGHSIEEVISTGEQLYVSGGLKEFLQHYPSILLHNFYGPSETHVITGVNYSYSRGDIPEKSTIGRPVYNSRVYILDPLQQLTPIGIEGEVYLAGWHLARGYQGRPDLTAEKFIPDPFYPGELMYRSGDIGRWLESGELEYNGRRDNQLKINGYRVELGEIESLLRSADGIEEAIVIAIGEQDKELAAYIVSQQEQDISQLRGYLSARLPFYMVPLYYQQLPALPLTVNGKVDKRALPHPGVLVKEYIAPRTPTEETLAAIWSDILGRDQIGVTDNFFDLGGHSLKATRLVSQVRKRFSIDFSIRQVFTEPTIAAQAVVIDNLLWINSEKQVEEDNTEREILSF